MSEPERAPEPSPRRRYTGGQILMIAIGATLLLPGLCSLVAIVIAIAEWWSGQAGLAGIGIWTIGLLVAAIGVVLIVVARVAAGKPK